MPQVTKYGARQQSVAALPGVRLTAAATATSEGAGVEEARQQKDMTLARVGGQAANLGVELFARQQAEQRRAAEEERRRAIQLNVIEGENKLAAWERDRIYDPEHGALTVKGKDAMPLPETIDDEFEKVAGDAMQGMATPEAKAAFEQAVSSRRQNVGLTVRRHVSQEIQQYTASELKARIENGVQLAVSEGTADPTRGAAQLKAAEGAFRSMAPSLGLGPEQIEQQVATMHTQVHEGIIDQLVSQGNMKAARAYFDEAKDDIRPDRKDDIEKVLRAGGVKKESQVETEKILAAGGTLTEQRAKAKLIDDPDVQDEVIARLEHEDAVRKQHEIVDHRELLRGMADTIDRTRSTTSIPANEWAKLDPSERSAMRSYAKQLVEKGDVDTDFATYYGHIQALTKDPLKWAQTTNLMSDVHRIGKTELKQLVDYQHDILTATKKPDSPIEGVLSNQQTVSDVLLGAGLDPTPKPGDPAAKEVTDLRAEVDRIVNDTQRATGKKLSAQDVRTIANEQVAKVTLQKGSWTGLITSGPFYDVTKRAGQLTIGDMTTDDKTHAAEYLRAHNIPVSDATMLNAFRRLKVLEAQKAK